MRKMPENTPNLLPPKEFNRDQIPGARAGDQVVQRLVHLSSRNHVLRRVQRRLRQAGPRRQAHARPHGRAGRRVASLRGTAVNAPGWLHETEQGVSIEMQVQVPPPYTVSAMAVDAVATAELEDTPVAPVKGQVAG